MNEEFEEEPTVSSDTIIETLNGECPECGEPLSETINNGDECSNCGNVIWIESQY